MVISSNTNEWPQDQIDETGLMASSGRVMEKPGQEQALKCPRCDSSNTKFCYYNNYSLSQPRHFCKACKRYWTRGGTLRNVPVGGGCRKNKRLRRSASTNDSSPSLPTHPSPNPPRIDVSSASNHINSLFYGLPTTPSDINFPFPSFNSRISNVDTGYDLQSRLNALGLGFPSAAMTSEKHHDDYRNGFDPNSQTQEGVVTNSLLSDYSLLGSSSSPMMASLIASSLQQKKPILGSLKEGRPTSHFQALFPFEDLQVAGNGDLGMFMKEVKMEEGNKMEWNFHNQNPIEPVSLSDPSLYWNQFGHPLI